MKMQFFLVTLTLGQVHALRYTLQRDLGQEQVAGLLWPQKLVTRGA